MRSQTRAVVIISDIHAGSQAALFPPGFVTEEAQPVGQNPTQEWFWRCWTDVHQWLACLLPQGDPYALLLNGDMIEGNHHRTTEIIHPDAANHLKAAHELLSQVAGRASKTFMVRGTECHVGGKENALAKMLGAEVNPEFNQPYWDRLELDVCGKRISVAHHFPATSRSYLEASQYSIQLGNAVNEAVRSGDRAPDILVGAHRHRTGHFCDGNRLVVVTGAWQALTRHGFKVVPHGRPCPSVYVLDWRNREDGDMPEVHFRRYNPPASKAVALSL